MNQAQFKVKRLHSKVKPLTKLATGWFTTIPDGSRSHRPKRQGMELKIARIVQLVS